MGLSLVAGEEKTEVPEEFTQLSMSKKKTGISFSVVVTGGEFVAVVMSGLEMSLGSDMM